jgi:hypothetical protein
LQFVCDFAFFFPYEWLAAVERLVFVLKNQALEKM